MQNFEDDKLYIDYENSDGYGIFWSEKSESLDSELRSVIFLLFPTVSDVTVCWFRIDLQLIMFS